MKEQRLLINEDYQGRVEVLRHASRGILIQDGSILLGYEEKTGRYILPGGGVEKGETPEDACEREILEETGICCRVGDEYLEIIELFDVRMHINHYFVCEVLEETGEISLTEYEKQAGCTARWVPLKEALWIFGRYECYRESDITVFGLYKREYTALRILTAR